MKILLLKPASPSRPALSTAEKRPPLGLGYLIATRRAAGDTVTLVDEYVEPGTFDPHALVRGRVDLLGLYLDTITFPEALRAIWAADSLRRRGLWGGRIVAGGPHTTVCADTIPDAVDHVVQGEGEIALAHIAEGRDVPRLYRGPKVTDLDALPRLPWDEFVRRPYDFRAEWFDGGPVFTLNTSRGCPFPCTFCSVGSIWGKKYTTQSAGRMVDDIEFLMRTYGARGIYFREDNFTLSLRRTVAFCELLLSRGIEIQWACETRVDSIDDPEIVRLMARAGCKGYFIGVESGNARVLASLQKGIRIDQTERVFLYANRHGIRTSASLILGVPGETDEERVDSIAFAYAIRPTVKWINKFIGIPTSRSYEQAIETGVSYTDPYGVIYPADHNRIVDSFFAGKPSLKVPEGEDGRPPPLRDTAIVYRGRTIDFASDVPARRQIAGLPREDRAKLACLALHLGTLSLHHRTAAVARRYFCAAWWCDPASPAPWLHLAASLLPLRLARPVVRRLGAHGLTWGTWFERRDRAPMPVDAGQRVRRRMASIQREVDEKRTDRVAAPAA
jgi:radical SAM superfamily enzyme YgiQ (UPF0313 family)